jgi:hypothetical protein
MGEREAEGREASKANKPPDIFALAFYQLICNCFIVLGEFLTAIRARRGEQLLLLLCSSSRRRLRALSAPLALI